MVVVTGPRQVGKTTLARNVMGVFGPRSQYLNWDVPADRAILGRQSWSPRAPLLVLDEIHKMPDWKSWLKGVADARPPDQVVLVTGSRPLRSACGRDEALAFASEPRLVALPGCCAASCLRQNRMFTRSRRPMPT